MEINKKGDGTFDNPYMPDVPENIGYSVIEVFENEVEIKFNSENDEALYLEYVKSKRDYIPEKISSRQLRSQLILQGFNLETIEQALNQLPEPNRSLAKVDWEYATNFYRNNAMIVAVGQLLNLTNEQIDEIFRQGEKL